MNNALQRVCATAQKPVRRIIGLMSGTSLDGLDIALCRIEGSGRETRVELEHFHTAPYSNIFKSEIKSVFSKGTVELQKLTLLNAEIGRRHAEMVLQFLEEYHIPPGDIDCIASHGQTVYHAPKRLHGLDEYPNATLQIGDGDHIAFITGIPTLSDFRQKHVAAGGEGAPLALYGDCILFSSPLENRVLLNIGGISNFTYLPATASDEMIICSDVGPGNTLIDAVCRMHFNRHFDHCGELASSGEVNMLLLDALLSHAFFKEKVPKTTGPELFNIAYIKQAELLAGIKDISAVDTLATVTRLTAIAIAQGLKKALDSRQFSLYVSGGGCHNTFLIDQIRELLPQHSVELTEKLGVNPDAKEAILFALLANETLCGSAIYTGGGPQVMMGKLSLP